MSDFKLTNKVVQDNKLVQQTNWTLNEIPLKIFKVLVSCINTSKQNEHDIITITKNELMSIVGTGKNYSFLETQLKSLLDEKLVVGTEESRIYLSIIDSVEWFIHQDIVKVRFSPTIMPFLVELKNNFLQYDVTVVKELKSKYSLIIYEYLLSRERKERNKDKTYRISLKELRIITATVDKYTDMRNFEKRILIASKGEINKTIGLEFLMDYEKVKVGRRIQAIDFKIRRRTSYKENEFETVENPEWLSREI